MGRNEHKECVPILDQIQLKPILMELTNKVYGLLGCDLEAVILYGSYARGDNAADSDVDIMVLTKNADVINRQIRSELNKIFSRTGLEYDLVISLAIKDKETFEQWLPVLPFYQNVHSEGVVLYAPDVQEDDVRVYVPLDLNRKAILRRLEIIIAHYGFATEENEFSYSGAVDEIISQLEMYDKVCCSRNMPQKGKHSCKAIAIVQDIIALLEDLPDGGAELFPFELITELKKEYLATLHL